MGIIYLLLLIVVYFAPSIIGYLRHVRNLGTLIVVNVAFGWSFIGWFIALALAFKSTTPVQVTYVPPTNVYIPPQRPAVPVDEDKGTWPDGTPKR
jgi:hypothetical protein